MGQSIHPRRHPPHPIRGVFFVCVLCHSPVTHRLYTPSLRKTKVPLYARRVIQFQTNPPDGACARGRRPHTATRVASSSRGARVRVIRRPSRSRSRRLSLSLSLSLALARAMTGRRPSASRLDDPSTRDARAPIERDARATDERWWRSLSALRLDADARARRDDTVTR